jgi:glycosyltransferase involved in cell wall biosynthesis
MTMDPLGGVFGYALTLAKRLSEEGIPVLLASMGGVLSREQRREVRSVAGVTLVESTFALEWMDDPWNDVQRAGEWLLALERRFRPSLVHLNGYSHAAEGFSAPVLVVAHSCVSSWWRAVWNEPAPARYDEYRARVLRGLSAASAVGAPSRAMLAALTAEYDVLLPRALVIHNGVPADRFVSGIKERFVLACGRLWDRAKNVGDFAALAGALAWPLYLAGETASPDGRTVTVPPEVRHLGTLSPSEMAHVMSRASIFVHPALYEPFGLAPLEAALSGCALVLADIPSLREIWHGAAAFVPPRDARGFVEVVNGLADDDVRRRELAANARRRALCFSERAMVDAYLSLYRSLALPAQRAGHGSAPHPGLTA